MTFEHLKAESIHYGISAISAEWERSKERSPGSRPRVFLYPCFGHTSTKTPSFSSQFAVPVGFWWQAAAMSLVTFRKSTPWSKPQTRVSGLSFFEVHQPLAHRYSDLSSGRKGRWQPGSACQPCSSCVSCSFVWWVDSSALLSGNTSIFYSFIPPRSTFFAIMKAV